MGIFEQILLPWKTDKNLENLDRVVSIVMFMFLLFTLLLSLGIGGSFSDFINTNISSIFLLFLLLFSITKIETKEYASFGTSSSAYTAMVFGIIAAILMSASSMSMIPLAALPSFTMINLINIALIVPFVEEKFFGRILPFYLSNSIKNKIIVVVMTASIFAGFHYISYGSAIFGSAIADPTYVMIVSLSVAFVFRVISLFGNGVLRTSAFGDSLHYLNNILSVLRFIKV